MSANRLPMRVLLCILSNLFLFIQLWAQSDIQPKSISAVKINSNQILLDGRVDESFWDEIEGSSGFLMQEPIQGGQPTEQTVIKQYNLHPQGGSGNVLRDRVSGLSVATNMGETIFTAASGESRTFEVQFGFNQFKNMLSHVAEANDVLDPAVYWGEDWDWKQAWRVSAIQARLEITGNNNEETQCGGSLSHINVKQM